MKAGNYRLAVAVQSVRLDRNPGTMAELRDAINARSANRSRKLTEIELATFQRRYLAEHAPDLLRYPISPANG